MIRRRTHVYVDTHLYVYICMTHICVYIPSFQSPYGPSAVASTSLKSHRFLALTPQKGKALSHLKPRLEDLVGRVFSDCTEAGDLGGPCMGRQEPSQV